MQTLDEITFKYNISFSENENYFKEIILEIYNNNIDVSNYDMDNSLILNLIGQYYNIVNINYDKMKKYYLMAIERGNNKSMYNLATYYKNIEKNNDEMLKYYLMAVENNYELSLLCLGTYYWGIENYDEMIKYYLMVIEKEK